MRRFFQKAGYAGGPIAVARVVVSWTRRLDTARVIRRVARIGNGPLFSYRRRFLVSAMLRSPGGFGAS